MPKQYEYLKDGVVTGPITGKELHRLAAAGQLSPTDLIRAVSAEGGGPWTPAVKARNLSFPESPAPPSPPDLPAPQPDQLAAPCAAAPAHAVRPAYAPSGRGGVILDYALAALWACLGGVWAIPVGFTGVFMVLQKPEKTLVVAFGVSLGCLLVLFAAIPIPSIRVRAGLGLVLLLPWLLLVLSVMFAGFFGQ